MPEIVNPLTGLTSCFFEPALDYVVVKAPRWQFENFPGASRRLGPEMKSIGESMGIAEDFSTAFAKAWAMTQGSQLSYPANWPMNRLREELAQPSDQRMRALFAAFQQGLKLEEIQALTGISSWFLCQFEAMSHQFYPTFKWPHFCSWGLRQIDSLAGEFPACSPYLYLSPFAEFHFGAGPWVLVLGSGPYGIGSSVEFDFCCVSGVQALQAAGYRVAMLNANPETLSSDYDLADALIFEPLLPESINAVVAALRPVGILASLGGQVPQNLLAVLPQHWPFWGTPLGQIRRAENRLSFALALDQLSLPQPPWSRADNLASALAFGEKVGYPLIFRSACVLGGSGMAVIADPEALKSHFESRLIDLNGALLNRFLPEAREFEIDGIARSGQLEYYLFSENVENAGIHSGDSHHLFPALQLSETERSQALDLATRLVHAFEISGLFNLQFLSLEGQVLVLEANLRASRNLPFLSHVCGQNLIALAITRLLSPTPLLSAPIEISAQQVGIRAPSFSWHSMVGHEPVLGVVMKATGEFCALAESQQLAWDGIYSHSGRSHTAVLE
ncbi:MAG: ATP-grasp domain-containing protein [Candidatus Sericytochromatia bacterium]